MKKQTTVEVKISMDELLEFMGYDIEKYKIEEIDAASDDEFVNVVVMEIVE